MTRDLRPILSLKTLPPEKLFELQLRREVEKAKAKRRQHEEAEA